MLMRNGLRRHGNRSGGICCACRWRRCRRCGAQLAHRARSAQDATAAGADRPDPARRFRPGLRFRLAHHPDAEGVAADAVARDRAAHRDRRSAQYEAIVARGGWPEVPPTDRLRLGNRHPSVVGAAPAADRGAATSTPTPARPTSSIPTSRRRCAASRRATASPSTASCASRPSRRSTCRPTVRLAQLTHQSGAAAQR